MYACTWETVVDAWKKILDGLKKLWMPGVA